MRLLLALALAGCSWTFDTSAPDLPLGGRPVPSVGRSIGRVDGQVVKVMPGLFGPWAILYFDDGSNEISGQVAAVQLADSPSVQIYERATFYYLGKRYLYLFSFTDVEVVVPGESSGVVIGFGNNAGDPNMTLFEDEGYLTANIQNTLIMYCMANGEQRTACSNCLAQRNLGRPNGTARLYLPDGSGGILGAASPCRPDLDNVSLPRAPGALAGIYADDDDHGVALCTDQGLFVVDTGTSELAKVDPDPCKSVLGGRDTRVLYQTGDWVRAYDFSTGSVGNITTSGVTGLWQIGPSDAAVRRDDGLYVNGAGDGWVGRWRFMERGYGPRFTSDGEAMTFLDHAATVNGAGLLIQAPLYGRSPQVNLARNVTRWDRLPDGRIVAASNHAFDGPQNRVVLVDVEHGEARLLAESAVDVQLIPGRNEALVEKYGTTDGEHLLVRVPIPDYPY